MKACFDHNHFCIWFLIMKGSTMQQCEQTCSNLFNLDPCCWTLQWRQMTLSLLEEGLETKWLAVRMAKSKFENVLHFCRPPWQAALRSPLRPFACGSVTNILIQDDVTATINIRTPWLLLLLLLEFRDPPNKRLGPKSLFWRKSLFWLLSCGLSGMAQDCDISLQPCAFAETNISKSTWQAQALNQNDHKFLPFSHRRLYMWT